MEGLEAMAAFNNPCVMAAGVAKLGHELNLPADTKTWLKKLGETEGNTAGVPGHEGPYFKASGHKIVEAVTLHPGRIQPKDFKPFLFNHPACL